MDPFRKVVSVKNYIDKHATGTQGSNWLKLECGYEANRRDPKTGCTSGCNCAEG